MRAVFIIAALATMHAAHAQEHVHPTPPPSNSEPTPSELAHSMDLFSNEAAESAQAPR